MKILFISFEDSFEKNILSYLNEFSSTTIKHHRCLSSNDLNFDGIILGPGPGHVDEYCDVFEFVKLASVSGIALVGICLGHQILLKVLFNASIVKSLKPVHGRRLRLSGEGGDLVQRYNSWTCIDLLPDSGAMTYDENGELAIFESAKLLTFQFHPESVGTNCPTQYFKKIHSFIVHNIKDELESKRTLQS